MHQKARPIQEKNDFFNHTIAVNKLLGYQSRVAMTKRSEHNSNPSTTK